MPVQTEIKEGQCGSCRIFIDGVEEHHLEEYRDHKICLHCQNEWRRREQMVRRKITWDEFRKGRLKGKSPRKLTPRREA